MSVFTMIQMLSISTDLWPGALVDPTVRVAPAWHNKPWYGQSTVAAPEGTEAGVTQHSCYHHHHHHHQQYTGSPAASIPASPEWLQHFHMTTLTGELNKLSKTLHT